MQFWLFVFIFIVNTYNASFIRIRCIQVKLYLWCKWWTFVVFRKFFVIYLRLIRTFNPVLCTYIFKKKFFMKKVRKLRVPWESIWTISFWKVSCLFAMVFCPVFLWSSLVGQKFYRYYYVSGEFLERLRKQPKLKFFYIW